MNLNGPHGYLDPNGLMMESETNFAEKNIRHAIETNNGKCDVIDVGSNFGYFSLIALSFGCRVFNFEPNKYNFDLSQLNMFINNYTNATSYNRPVGVGNVTFDGWMTTSAGVKPHSVEDWIAHEPIVVQSVPISDVSTYSSSIDWFKLDVEGFENAVIQTVPDNMSIASLSIEINYYVKGPVNYSDTYKFIEKRFKKCLNIDQGNQEVNTSNVEGHINFLNANHCSRSHNYYCQANLLCHQW